MSDRFHVVTGGPGAGKTTLVDAWAAAGGSAVREGARDILRDMDAAGFDVHDWRKGHGFGEAMRLYDEAAWEDAQRLPGDVLFDRGLPDIVGFYCLSGLAVPPALDQAIARCRYHERVFILPPWPDIYGTDAERNQTPQEAEASYEAMRTTYPDYGYWLLEVPRLPVAQRLAWVAARISR